MLYPLSYERRRQHSLRHLARSLRASRHPADASQRLRSSVMSRSRMAVSLASIEGSFRLNPADQVFPADAFE